MITFLVGVGFCLYGIYGCGVALVKIWMSILSVDWPTAHGTIVLAKLETTGDAEGGTGYRTKILYKFVVDGKELIGDHSFFGDDIWLPFAGPSRKLKSSYPAGHEVVVYYDPRKPSSHAVLRPGVHARLIFALAMKSVFALIGAAAVRGGWVSL